MSARLAVAAVVLSIAVAWTPNAVFGGVSNLSQDRTVTASIIDSGATETHHSNKTGKFDQSAKAHFMNELGDHDDVSTSQTSTIGSNSVSASGKFETNSQGEEITYSNTIDASFAVTAKTNYHLSFAFAFDEDTEAFAEDLISLKLRKTGSPSPTFSKVYGGQEIAEVGSHVHLASSGPLAPGEYELQFAMHDDVAQQGALGHYDLQFSIDNGTTHPVPLPPAAWTGLLTLAALAGAMAYARRRTGGFRPLWTARYPGTSVPT